MHLALQHPVPLPWLINDVLTLFVTLLVLVYLVRKSKEPAITLIECFVFVFLYAGIFENFAVMNGWYVYGRSLFMFGEVPLSVPLLELDVFVAGLWMLDKMAVPGWTKPVILGMLGMLQDLSLDPLAVRQIFSPLGTTTGRWTWLIDPSVANIYRIPVYNFPGWMLIMLYFSAFLLAGRWWYRRSGYRKSVGYSYPFIAVVLSLGAMGSPLSNFLLWLAPFYSKGSVAEWVMLSVNFLVPIALLSIFWKGRMRSAFRLKDDLPIVAVPLLFHATDITSTIAGGYREILWLVLAASAVHFAIVALVVARGYARGSVSSALRADDRTALRESPAR